MYARNDRKKKIGVETGMSHLTVQGWYSESLCIEFKERRQTKGLHAAERKVKTPVIINAAQSPSFYTVGRAKIKATKAGI